MNENAHAPPVEDDEADPVNNRAALSQEATYLHQAFTQQVRCASSRSTRSCACRLNHMWMRHAGRPCVHASVSASLMAAAGSNL